MVETDADRGVPWVQMQPLDEKRCNPRILDLQRGEHEGDFRAQVFAFLRTGKLQERNNAAFSQFGDGFKELREIVVRLDRHQGDVKTVGGNAADVAVQVEKSRQKIYLRFAELSHLMMRPLLS